MSVIDIIKEYWWLITVVLGAIGYIVTVAIKGHDLVNRLGVVEARNEEMKQDISMLLKAQFATLDGLKQLNCNGQVSKAHETMQEYVLSRH